MSSPRERLKKVAESIVPQKVVFRPQLCKSKKTVKFAPLTLKDLSFTPNDEPLQKYLMTYFTISPERQHESVDQRIDGLFRYVKEAVCSDYTGFSSRSSPTKRKTCDFVNKIPLDNTILSNFLLVLYLKEKERLTSGLRLEEERTLFETLESLRRIYGDQI